MVVMCRFNKGMFEPTDVRSGSFNSLKDQAFDGSDYTNDEEWTMKDTIILIALAVGLLIVPIIAFLWYIIYVWRARKRVNKDLLWYRDIPMGGNLQQTNDMLNAYKYFNTDYNNLLSACILKLINLRGITIEQHLNEKGKNVQNFAIHELKDADKQPILLRKVHQIFQKAAGSDTILEPKELKSFMRSNYNQSRGATSVRPEEIPQGVLAHRRAPRAGSIALERLYDLCHSLWHCRPGDQRHEEDQSRVLQYGPSSPADGR